MKQISDTLKLSIRQAFRSPGITITCILTLALGIGAATTIFSLVESVLLRPLPFPQPQRLMLLGDHVVGTARTVTPAVPAAEIRPYMQQMHAFQQIGAYRFASFDLTGVGSPAHITASRMSSEIFSLLGIKPLLGRGFTADEDHTQAAVTVLSYGLWQDRFGGSDAVLGKTISLDRKPYQIIGVMPAGFEFPIIAGSLNQARLWVPLSLTTAELATGVATWDSYLVGKLKENEKPSQAEAEAEEVARGIMRSYPAFMASLHIEAVVSPLQEASVSSARSLLHVLWSSALILLLLSCLNTAGLLLVRAIKRQHEIAVQLALGASRTRIALQSVSDGLLVSLLGSSIGVTMGWLFLHPLVALLPDDIPRASSIGFDGNVVAIAVAFAIVTGVFCSAAPIFAGFHHDAGNTLKAGGGRSGTSSSGHARVRSALVASQIAMALLLITSSFLLLRSLQEVSRVDLGFRPEHLTVAQYSLPTDSYHTQSAVDGFNRALLSNIREFPGASVSALSSYIPMLGSVNTVAFVPDGHIVQAGEKLPLAGMTLVSGDYFRAMGIRLLRGRLLANEDDATSQLVCIVNHKLATTYWGNADPIGKRLRMGTAAMHTQWLTVVGEVGDVHGIAPDTDAGPEYYQPIEQYSHSLGEAGSQGGLIGNWGYILLRNSMSPSGSVDALRSAVRQLDPSLILNHLTTMDVAVTETESSRRFDTALISCFALFSLLLTVIGIYAIIRFTFAFRTRELALRLALGATRQEILKIVIVYALRLALIGCSIGIVGVLFAGRILKSLLFEVSSFDPSILALALLIVTSIVIATSVMAARRIVKVDPVIALRAE